MDSGSLAAVSQQKALFRRMELIAQNLANTNTFGYKGESARFGAHVKSMGQNHKISFVQEQGTFRDFSEGAGQPTGHPLHLMIHGEGFFAVQTKQGVRYTRCGAFELNAEAQIVTAEGDPLLDGSGSPIVVPVGAASVSVAQDGTISADGHILGKVQAVRFADAQALTPEGAGLYRTEQNPEQNAQAQILQGFLEGSNVNPVLAIAEMIEVSRRYEEIQNLLNSHKERQDSATDQLVNIA